jgi:hypothetical protein
LQIDATDLLPARATAGLDGQTSRSRRCRKDCATAFLTNGVTSFFVELTSYIQVHTKCQYVCREENRSGVDQELRYGSAGIDISSEWARWTRQRLEIGRTSGWSGRPNIAQDRPQSRVLRGFRDEKVGSGSRRCWHPHDYSRGRRAETCSKEYKRAEARANGQEIIHETERTRFRLGADAAAVFNSATPP